MSSCFSHNDLAWQLWVNERNRLGQVNLGESLIGIWNITHTDIPRLREGKLGAQVKHSRRGSWAHR